MASDLPECRQWERRFALVLANGAGLRTLSGPGFSQCNPRGCIVRFASTWFSGTNPDSICSEAGYTATMPRTLIDLNSSMSAHDLFASTDAWTLMARPAGAGKVRRFACALLP